MILLDPWEEIYIDTHPHRDLIVWDDFTAVDKYFNDAWFYDKHSVHNKYNKQRSFDLEKEIPNAWPVMVKPRTNLIGLGKGAYKAWVANSLKKRKGMIAQPFYKGTQYSIDVCKYKGKIVDSFGFITNKDSKGVITHFSSTHHVPDIVQKIVNDCSIDTIIMNIETIDENVIEVHLRPSLQFYDICDNMISGFLHQYARNVPVKDYQPSGYEKTYSVVCRVSQDLQPRWKEFDKLPHYIRSIQLCYEKGDWLSEWDQDETTYRVFVINGTDLEKIEKYAKKLYKELTKS